MKKIYSYDSYKQLILDKIASLPDKGRGITQKLSEHLRVHPSFVSQVLKGDKHFSAEQIFSTARFFSMNPLERDFLIGLLQHERAGTHELKMYYQEQLSAIRKKSKFVSKRIEKKTILSERDQARYYSDWVYSAIRILCTQHQMTLNKICEKYDLSSQKATMILDFLMSVGLIFNDGPYFSASTIHTHLPGNSPFIISHHKNWRMKAMVKHSDLTEDELAFSAPFGITKSDFALIKEELLEIISKVSSRVKDSPTEEVACMNLDLFYL